MAAPLGERPGARADSDAGREVWHLSERRRGEAPLGEVKRCRVQVQVVCVSVSERKAAAAAAGCVRACVRACVRDGVRAEDGPGGLGICHSVTVGPVLAGSRTRAPGEVRRHRAQCMWFFVCACVFVHKREGATSNCRLAATCKTDDESTRSAALRGCGGAMIRRNCRIHVRYETFIIPTRDSESSHNFTPPQQGFQLLSSTTTVTEKAADSEAGICRRECALTSRPRPGS